MQMYDKYFLIGYLDNSGTESGFKTPVFENKDGYCIQMLSSESKVSDFISINIENEHFEKNNQILNQIQVLKSDEPYYYYKHYDIFFVGYYQTIIKKITDSDVISEFSIYNKIEFSIFSKNRLLYLANIGLVEDYWIKRNYQHFAVSKGLVKKNTPIKQSSNLLQLNKIWGNQDVKVFAKVDMLSPNDSVKRNMIKYIIDDAESMGLRKGDTIIEIIDDCEIGQYISEIAGEREYEFVCMVSSKISSESIDILKAYGCKVYISPSNVSPDDPRSVYSIARRLHEEIRGSIYLNLNFNNLNSEAHYKITGPEIWNQTNGEITHFISTIKTGGTISGVGRYLKEINPDIKIIGIDAYGSVLEKYFQTREYDSSQIYPYRMNFGNNLIPSVCDFDIIDNIVKVTDESSAHTTRSIADIEKLLIGYSSGAAYRGFLQIFDEIQIQDGSTVVIYFPDNGYHYLSKVYNDKWMMDQGFMNEIDIEQIKETIYIR